MAVDVNGYHIKNVKNAAGKYTLQVFSPDNVEVGIFHHDDSAHRAAERHFYKSKNTVRSCMCCSAEFTSTGAHHRMCDLCRTKPGGLI